MKLTLEPLSYEQWKELRFPIIYELLERMYSAGIDVFNEYELALQLEYDAYLTVQSEVGD